MQLLETHVGSVVDGKLTVEFVGEGGELVSVRMVTDDRSLGGRERRATRQGGPGTAYGIRNRRQRHHFRTCRCRLPSVAE